MSQEATEHSISKRNSSAIEYPITLDEFLKAEIPPVQYILKPVLPEKGKLLISAHQGSCKTFVVLNLACAISSGISPYLDEIDISKRKVLCVIGEGGESELKRRLERMAEMPGINKENLILTYEPNMDICDGKEKEDGFDKLKSMITDWKPQVLILDPIGQLWSGNENEKQEVKCLTALFDSLIQEYQISLIVTQHWKKPGKNMSEGGHMASGSYWWIAWVDGHITLKGNAKSLNLHFDKIRSNEGGVEYKDLTLRLSEENFWMDCIGIKGEQVNKQQLNKLFNSFGSERVKFNDLADKTEEERLCSRNTLYKILESNSEFIIDKSKKSCFYVCKNDLDDNGSTFKT